ncbi:hypothetical protein KCU81_g318, partial [Aureobasidium melanogenum]
MSGGQRRPITPMQQNTKIVNGLCNRYRELMLEHQTDVLSEIRGPSPIPGSTSKDNTLMRRRYPPFS